MGTISCHRNRVLIRLGQKTIYSFPLPINAICEICENHLHGFRGDVIENVVDDDDDRRRTDGRTTDACLYNKLTYEPSA